MLDCGQLYNRCNNSVVDHLDMELPAKRKRTLNPKLTSEDNVHEDAVKRRRAHQTTTTTKQSSQPYPATTRGEETAAARQRAPSAQPSDIESDADTAMVDTAAPSSSSDHEPSIVEGRCSVEIEEISLQEESDEQELGKLVPVNHTLEDPE